MIQKFTLLFIFCMFGSSIFAQDRNLQTATKYIQYSLEKYKLVPSDINDLNVTDNYTSPNGISHVFLQQQYQGIPIHDAYTQVNVAADGQIVYPRCQFVSEIGTKISATSPSISGAKAVLYASNFHSLIPVNLVVQSSDSSPSQKTIFNTAGIASEPIKAELVYFQENDQLKLCWKVSIVETNAPNAWESFVDASNAAILHSKNHVISCNFQHSSSIACSDNPAHRLGNLSVDNHQEQLEKSAATGDYNVFPMPIESPNHGPRAIVNSPWVVPTAGTQDAFTNQWHNDGGNTYPNVSRGNNVDAYEDRNNSNGPTGGNGARAVTTNGDFDFPLDFNQAPANSDDAAITNLFYWSNIIHDVIYQYGFDEPSGNFQTTNFGRGGNGGDEVLAEAQDGGGTNNANFATPADGTNPRMQMYLWSAGAGLSTVTVNDPGGIAGNYGHSESGFSINNKLADVGPITGDLELAINIEACNATPITNGAALNGKIAVIDRGNCNFTEKVANAEAVGAIAVVMCNNVAGAPIVMGGADDGITIPAIMLSQTDCNTIKVEMASGTVNMTMSAVGGTGQPIDGDYDNGIIIHEYGHGISTRLTGGPSSSCLGGNEQQGEGWSDYYGLMMTTDFANVDKNDIRGIGTYATGQGISGGGIRPFPYSYDMAINPVTYADISNNATFTIPHGVGSVWCAMIWDMTWNIIEKEGVGTNDIYVGSNAATPNGGQNISMQLVTDGLKLQGCNPTFVSSRDAILAADAAEFNEEYKCQIWAAFSRRGVGFSAASGSTATGNETVTFDMPPNTDDLVVTKTANVVEAPEGSTVTYTIDVRNVNCTDITNATVSDIIPSGLTYVDASASGGGTYNGGALTSSYPQIATLATATTVSYTFDVTVDPGAYIANLPSVEEPVNDDIEGGTGNWTTSTNSGANIWATSNAFPNSGATSWFSPNANVDAEMILETAANLPLEGCPTFSFTHSWNTEAGWDGGVVEISTNGGGTWLDMAPHFTANGYNSVIAGNAPNNVLAGRAAYTGNSNGYVTTTADLCEFSGQNVLIRFRAGSDDNTTATGANVGWYIDDISVLNEAGIINEAVATHNTLTGTGDHCLRIVPSILSVDLLDLTATADNAQQLIAIDWTTASETNNKGFHLQRSSGNQVDFKTIAWIDGQGTSSSSNEYQYNDLNVRQNVNYYYRLVQVDEDGSEKPSSIVTARLKKTDSMGLSISPNPTSSSITIESNSEDYDDIKIELLSMDGRVLEERVLSQEMHHLQLDLSSYPSSVYLVRATVDNIVTIDRVMLVK